VLSDEAMPRYAGDVFLPNVLIPIGLEVQLLHVALLADLRQGIDNAELDARLTTLIGLLVEQAAPGRLTARRPATSAAHRRIVDKVREVIAADPASFELGELAADLGHSPFHVSRVFHRATGSTLTHHRNRVRVAAAIDRLAAGEDNLAQLAADLGFADQSHLARVLRQAVGLPPGRLQRWLAGHRRTSSADRTTRSKPNLPAASYRQ
jgi:AraC-like DNA-binding protein